MKIGITYDLRQDYLDQGYKMEETAEFDKIETIEGIDNALISLGFETDRIGNIKALVNKLAEGKRWDIVFNIAEGMHGLAREAQIPALLDAYQIPYTFSDSFMLSLCLHKGMTKTIVKNLGIQTPDYYLVKSEEDIKNINLHFPLFVKPIAEGTGKGITASSRIETPKALGEACKKLLKEFNQPVLVETYLTGREFTVGVVGSEEETKVIGVMEINLNDNAEKYAYSYVNKENYEQLVTYEMVEGEVAEKCSDLALKVWKGLHLRDAGRLDIMLDANGVPNFLEVNPLAGLNPVTSDLSIMCSKLGISFQELIDMIMQSALKRINKQRELVNDRK